MSLEQTHKPSPDCKSSKSGFGLSQHKNELSFFVAIIVLYVVFTFVRERLLSFNNQINILRDAATIGIAAWAATLIIIAGEIDAVCRTDGRRSFPSYWLSGQWVLRHRWPCARDRGRCFADPSQWRAARLLRRAILRCHTRPVERAARYGSVRHGCAACLHRSQRHAGRARSLAAHGTPAAIIMLVLFAVFASISKTAFGRSVFAIGGNAHAAFLSGISVSKIRGRVICHCRAWRQSASCSPCVSDRQCNGCYRLGIPDGSRRSGRRHIAVWRPPVHAGNASWCAFAITLIGNGLVLLGINLVLPAGRAWSHYRHRRAGKHPGDCWHVAKQGLERISCPQSN